MASWQDVRNFIDNGESMNPIPEGMEVFPVVGVTFVPEYPNNILKVREAMESRQSDLIVTLTRRPDNPYDNNAIEVRTMDDRMLGHLSREVAAKIAPQMDAGKHFRATVFQVRVSPENPNNPGIDILIGEVSDG